MSILLRAALRVFLLAILVAGLVRSSAAEPAPAFDRLSGIRVDVGPLAARGYGPQAALLREDLSAALARAFAGRLGGGGPSLVVRVRSLSLNPYAGSGGRGFGGGLQSDYLDGEALLVGRNGAVLARHPQLSALPSSSGGAWYDPESERRRVAAIAEHYAQWLSRTLPAR